MLSSALATNGNGVVSVGFATRTFGNREPFRWNANDPFQQGSLDPTGNTLGEARAVSNDGSVIAGFTGVIDGNFTSPFESFTGKAFRWTEATGIVGLGPLAGADDSAALAMSSDGKWIGGWSDGGAFLWAAPGGMFYLQDFLLANGVIAASDWTFSRITGMSADGRVLTGWGTLQGVDQPFLVTIPEPSTWVLFVFASLALLRGTRARRTKAPL